MNHQLVEVGIQTRDRYPKLFYSNFEKGKLKSKRLNKAFLNWQATPTSSSLHCTFCDNGLNLSDCSRCWLLVCLLCDGWGEWLSSTHTISCMNCVMLRVMVAHDNSELLAFGVCCFMDAHLGWLCKGKLIGWKGEDHADDKLDDTCRSILHGNPSCYTFRSSVGTFGGQCSTVSWTSLHRLCWQNLDLGQFSFYCFKGAEEFKRKWGCVL